MSREFELIRISDTLDKLKREQDQLKFNLTRKQREELVELERVRREFSSNISTLEMKQVTIQKEIRDTQLKYDQLKLVVQEEKRRETESEQKRRDDEKRTRLHL